MDQTEQGNTGFSLPDPDAAPANELPTTQEASTEVPSTADLDAVVAGAENTFSRDLLIGGGILLVLLVIFFFAKSAYANTLVAKRLPPNKANAAGWWLYVFMSSLATGVVLSVVSAQKFLTPMIMGPIAALAVVSLVLMLLASRK